MTPDDLLDRAIAQIDGYNGQVNAVVRRMYDYARASIADGLPDGPLRGVPLLLKDLAAYVEGVPTTGGCRLLESHVPTQTSTVVQRYLAAGAVIVGKTNTSELGLLGVTESALLGAARNPWAVDRTPGGSSGGSASAVASRMVPIAHGSDMGGSIRIPASCAGLVGLKPSRGRVPMGPGIGGAWPVYGVQHALTRSVRDSALMLDVAAGYAPGEPYSAPPPGGSYTAQVQRTPGKLRIGYCLDAMLGGDVQSEVVAAVDRAVRLCEGLGHRVEPARPQLDGPTLARAYLSTVAANVYAEVRRIERAVGRKAGSDIEPTTRLFYDIGRKSSAGQLVESARVAEQVGRVMADFHRDHDIFMLATIAMPPPRIGQFDPKPLERLGMWLLRRFPARRALAVALRQAAQGMLEALPNTQPFNMSGQPAISLPLEVGDAGLPIGIQFVAPYGREDLLLRLAGQLQAAAPWSDRVPPLLAQ